MTLRKGKGEGGREELENEEKNFSLRQELMHVYYKYRTKVRKYFPII